MGTTTIAIVCEDDGSYRVTQDGGTVVRSRTTALATEVVMLLVLCHRGDERACARLDALGLEPPVLEPDSSPLPAAGMSDERAEALALIGVVAAGREIVGVTTDRSGVARLHLQGGAVIVLEPDGGIAWLDATVLDIAEAGATA